MSGPSHAEEVVKGIPTTVVVGAKTKSTAEYIQDIFMNERFRVYTSPDIIGIELGASIKNVIALAAGMVDGLGLGDNTRAALMTRGLAEISRLGVAMGGKLETFSGLSGVGDLIVTCTPFPVRPSSPPLIPPRLLLLNNEVAPTIINSCITESVLSLYLAHELGVRKLFGGDRKSVV